ncbi:MAG: CCA tRNA nucleotidyltransferase [Jaaginema sp. PMC 1079.18]|nr:CCA tRNA nucleotidyltransferase [Jaaginema sp. PMC 1080.18]MEC4853108.1 CCA tRNA nucleotidyltransferase [Jaaginema sp. PMC 1079.18]MEC4864657.1 CCA tRNA nucleotidyltransferase [Jaaginema sp. PMC 1078.18]
MALIYNSLQLSPQDWPFDISLLPQPIYLVGGAVRDSLLGRSRTDFDLDFIVPSQAIATARRLAERYQAGFVILDEKRQIARVVFEGGTVDCAQQEGNSLEADLRRRDFTINAIAYDLHHQQFIDPLRGIKALEKRQIVMVSVQNLRDDPLRLLRAYRQAAQLDFAIAPRTHHAICQLAPLLKTIAAERVQTELNYLLSHEKGDRWLKMAAADGLLSQWLDDLTSEKLQQLAQVEQCTWLLGKIWQSLGEQLQTALGSQTLSWLALGKLACLVGSDPNFAEHQLKKLKYSRAEIRAVKTALTPLPRLLEVAKRPLSPREQYFFFQDVKEVFPLSMVLTVAIAAARGTLNETRAMSAVAPLINRYLDEGDRAAHPRPLVTGRDLLQFLNLAPSPAIGQLLTEIQIAHIEGKVETPEEALAFAAQFVERY